MGVSHVGDECPVREDLNGTTMKYPMGVLRLPKESLLHLHILILPVPRAGSSAALASGPGQGQQCEIVRWARPGGAPGACAGAQSHLRRALVGAVRMGLLGARIQFCVSAPVGSGMS
eukprot:scaffold10253_cov124-Isochrysis_galbana.AAC.2